MPTDAFISASEANLQTVSLVTAAVGLGLLMLLPRYLKRKRCVISKKVSQKEVMQGNHVFSTLPGSKDSPTFIRQQRDRSMSIGSDYQSTSTLTTLLAEGGPCTPQQLGLMGGSTLAIENGTYG
ncbi:unnamed protein product [Darwinula stevensoni]|uniref:Uncharacterized protein n=1 Tax=Darwinula stevensoni TaxID=69355 RepID=A0A7R8XA18_9CRUS|nr:unnamed protein product [Darwinula stevensoni]CAG0883210.1 unnamed protein product [Darwinula stevensoni]